MVGKQQIAAYVAYGIKRNVMVRDRLSFFFLRTAIPNGHVDLFHINTENDAIGSNRNKSLKNSIYILCPSTLSGISRQMCNQDSPNYTALSTIDCQTSESPMTLPVGTVML